MKRKGVILSLFLIMTLFIGCMNFNNGLKDKSNETWTIFMYLCGTDLESEYGLASDNLEEILDVKLNSNITYIIETGGTKSWGMDAIDSTKSQRFIVKNNKLVEVSNEEMKNMGESKTLEDFLNFGFNNYKADNYGFIFWNHGGGSISGIAFDENYGDDSLQLSEIRTAFENSFSNNKNNKFEFIGFDSCLMATVEIAAILEPYSKYMIASEEFEPGGGWSYYNWLTFISRNPSANGAQIGAVICDSYYKKCSNYESQEMVTLSVTDLSKIPKLVEKLDDISLELYDIFENKEIYSSVAKGILKSEKYGGSTEEEGFSNYIDLGDLMYNIKFDFKDHAEEVLEALDDAVIYMQNGSVRRKANGLSIYYPIQSDLTEVMEYRDIAPSENYKSFIEKSFNNSEYNINNKYNYVTIKEGPYINDDAYYEMIIDPDTIDYANTISFSLYSIIKDNENELLYLGNDTDLDVDFSTGRVTDNFRGVWPAIGNQLINMDVVEETDDYILYTVPVILNDIKTNLRISWIWAEDGSNNGHYEIIGVWDGINNDTGMSSRKVQKLKNGDKLSFIRYYYNLETEAFREDISPEIIVNSSTTIEEISLNPGEYYYYFNIKDIYGKEYSTDTVLFEIDEEGTIYIDK